MRMMILRILGGVRRWWCLHHGNAKNARLWYAWVPLLARQYRVVRLEARGFGRSSVPPEGYRWSLSRFAADLRGLLDRLGLERVHLIGETVGGDDFFAVCVGVPGAAFVGYYLHFAL